MGGSTYPGGERCQIGGSAHLVELAVGGELLHHGHKVYGVVLVVEVPDGVVNRPVVFVVETHRVGEVFQGVIQTVGLDQQCTEHGLLDVDGLRRLVAHQFFKIGVLFPAGRASSAVSHCCQSLLMPRDSGFTSMRPQYSQMIIFLFEDTSMILCGGTVFIQPPQALLP